MYIFYLFFQFTMIPETTKDPGSICTKKFVEISLESIFKG